MLAKAFPDNLKEISTRAKLLTLDKMKIHFLLFSLNRNIAAEFEKYDGLVAQLDRATAF